MRRLTDFFIVDGAGLSEDHVAMFDDVMSRLIVAIDKSARAEFGEMLARHPNAPKTSRILALDDEIAVAAPVLSHSRSLDDETLIETAKTKSQDHLFAITLRQSIGEAVTDVLVERGNSKVVVSAAGNPGAKFSDFGATTLADPLAGRCRTRAAGLVTIRYSPAALVELVCDRDRRGTKAARSRGSEKCAAEPIDRRAGQEPNPGQDAGKLRQVIAAAQKSIEALHRSGESDRRTAARIRATGKI